jgi:hypothetical protein
MTRLEGGGGKLPITSATTCAHRGGPFAPDVQFPQALSRITLFDRTGGRVAETQGRVLFLGCQLRRLCPSVSPGLRPWLRVSGSWPCNGVQILAKPCGKSLRARNEQMADVVGHCLQYLAANRDWWDFGDTTRVYLRLR